MDRKGHLYFGTGASSVKDYDGLYTVIGAALRSGIRHFDTAPSYGTEAALGNALKNIADEMNLSRSSYYIQTKIDPWQMQEGNIRHFVEDILNKMAAEYLDSLLIHWPVPEYVSAAWRDMSELYRSGIVKRIGVCNVRGRHIKNMLDYEVPPQIVQIERNPLRICEEEISLCQKHGIEIQAYSALCKMDKRIRDNEELKRIAGKYGKNVGQIVLRWHLDTGVMPVFTSKKPERIREYTEIFDFELSHKEMDAVSALNENYKMYLESVICPGF